MSGHKPGALWHDPRRCANPAQPCAIARFEYDTDASAPIPARQRHHDTQHRPAAARFPYKPYAFFDDDPSPSHRFGSMHSRPADSPQQPGDRACAGKRSTGHSADRSSHHRDPRQAGHAVRQSFCHPYPRPRHHGRWPDRRPVRGQRLRPGHRRSGQRRRPGHRAGQRRRL